MFEYPFSLCCESVDDFETLVQECLQVVGLLNTQAEEIRYWKHKVTSLLWILGQFDKEKVKALMEELEEDNGDNI